MLDCDSIMPFTLVLQRNAIWLNLPGFRRPTRANRVFELRTATRLSAAFSAKMGIQALLPLLQPVMKPAHIAEFAGKKVGIDSYAWLHRYSIACASELCLGLKEGKRKLTESFMARLALLRHHKLIPVAVFVSAPFLPCQTEHELTCRTDATCPRSRILKQSARTRVKPACKKEVCS